MSNLDNGRSRDHNVGLELAAAVRRHVAAAVDRKFSAREDQPLARLIVESTPDFSGLITALGELRLVDQTSQLAGIVAALAQYRTAIEAQTAAIKDQTATLEAAAMATRSVTYNKDGRVSQIRIGG